MKVFKDLYQYRELLKSNVKKEIRGKYKGSFLGVLWSFINPLLMVLVYAIVFPLILKNPEPNYVIFLIVGIIPWNFFTTVINQGTTTVVNNGNIIKKVYFPREILPISVVMSGLVNFFISCLIILIFIIFGGMSLSPVMLFLPLIAIIQFMLSLGLVFILSAIDVYVRDTEYIVNFIVMMLFYATPILYSSELFKHTTFAWIMQVNPMAHLINAYRDIFYYQVMPDMKTLGIVALVSFAIMVIGYQVFKKLERRFAEEL
ncbi:MAG TPA: ABC transporter permease [Candidatus Onthousia faecigallinarum]|nr:ABC transporter permease [Candidatus Onthousia faecigallinarum]